MNKYNLIFSTVLLCSPLCGCSENGFLFHSGSSYDDVPEKGVYYIGEPYRIKGVLYTPAENMNYSEKGMASWYSRDTQNRLTTNGEVFDDDQMTAAHKTLPLPSLVRITNLTNGNTAIVRVNDRGPAVNNRLIDVSRSVAEALEMAEVGTTPVQVDILPDESRRLKMALEEYIEPDENELAAVAIPTGDAVPIYQPESEVEAPLYEASSDKKEKQAAITVAALPPVAGSVPKVSPQKDNTSVTVAEKQTIQKDKSNLSEKKTPPPAGQFRIQAGVFGQQANADRAVQKLGKVASVTTTPKGHLTTVYVGPFKTKNEAKTILDKIKKMGYADAWIQTIK